MKPFKVAFLAFIAVAISIALYALFSPLLERRSELAHVRDSLRTDNDGISRRIDELRRKQAHFENNPEYVELIARQTGMARSNEIILDFSDPEEAGKTAAR